MKRPNGQVIPGLANCRVDLIEPHENAFGADVPDSVRSLRGRSKSLDGALRSRFPDPTVVTSAEAVLTCDVLDTLPDAGLIAFRWEFRPSACDRPKPAASVFVSRDATKASSGTCVQQPATIPRRRSRRVVITPSTPLKTSANGLGRSLRAAPVVVVGRAQVVTRVTVKSVRLR